VEINLFFKNNLKKKKKTKERAFSISNVSLLFFRFYSTQVYGPARALDCQRENE
jgi:hypothetical protein